jgi:hypothetical protein
MFFQVIISTFLLIALSYANPISTRAVDPPFEDPTSVMDAARFCPGGTANDNGIALLIHGTGSTGAGTWAAGPYPIFFPTIGFATCWIDLPFNSRNDAQHSASYVAYHIGTLAPLSATGKIVVVGHSQGAGLNIQWALLYWTSTRALVSRYIALAGDFHGTTEGPLFCAPYQLLGIGCEASLIQQSVGSHYITAQNVRGNQALVPTTSIFTREDDVIQDELINPTSVLPGADNFALQSPEVCGLLHVADHGTMVVDPAAVAIVALAISAGSGRTPIWNFDFKYCNGVLSIADVFLANELNGIYTGLANGTTDTGTPLKAEPPLRPYVCEAGDAPQALCSAE